MRPRLYRLILLGVVPALVLALAAVWWLQGARYVSTENAYVKTDIARVAAEVSGRALKVHAQAHMRVAKGDVLVEIDRQPFQLAVARAHAELDAARQQVETLRATLAEARAELKEAEDHAAYYTKRYERQLELVKRGIVSGSKHDELQNDARGAKDRVSMMRQKIRRVTASLGGDPMRPADDHPLVRARLVELEQARLDLARTTVRSPANGVVVNMPLVAGEQVKAGQPLFAIVTDASPWVDANFKETELTHVKVGQPATIVLDTYPGIVWHAEVQSISPATGAEFAILPPQNASGNWVKVVQRLPVRLKLTPRPSDPPLRAGMTAAVSIDTGRERSLSGLFGSVAATAQSVTGAIAAAK